VRFRGVAGAAGIANRFSKGDLFGNAIDFCQHSDEPLTIGGVCAAALAFWR